jgi:hypothetical protein
MKTHPISTDINPLEWVWNGLKQHVRKFRCTNDKEIIQACLEFQNKMSLEYFQKYIKN